MLLLNLYYNSIKDSDRMTYKITNYVKGITIFIVIINHYLYQYTTIDPYRYANGFMGIFFINVNFLIYYIIISFFVY